MGTDSRVCVFVTYFEGYSMSTSIFDEWEALSKAPEISKLPPTKHCPDTAEFKSLELRVVSVTGMLLVNLRREHSLCLTGGSRESPPRTCWEILTH